jgi:hypothetical protein
VRRCTLSLEDSQVRLGSLVEVAEGPLRVWNELHNFGIVASMPTVLGMPYADIVTNTGTHRLIHTEHLCVLSQISDEREKE